APVVLVPAMNDRMWANSQTARNVRLLRDAGITVLDPEEGPLAAGEGSGPGRMPEPETILAQLGRALEPAGRLRGRRVVVTAGATRESIDPVRFISNHSTGRMGVAISDAAWRRGADVLLVAAHVEVKPAGGSVVETVDTVAEMRQAVERALSGADVLVMAAAPADFRPAEPSGSKIKKKAGSNPGPIILTRTEDVLHSTMASRKKNAVIVGFALETEDLLANGTAKLEQKALDMIVVNSAVEEGAGFGSDTNRVFILTRNGEREDIPLMAKTDLADVILDRVELLIDGR
ncbi:MAG: bifunctional phosphopantothenoylcysteine decarboxylase/phosphopantothenate--cysteine ligase CoaBC, partial [Gemmatimonadota bacterium]|nr:bifunctional phosphopantothenoylcysteine decarboxylase/phosphopantothenate--cysteine ligase CoaBC [Gemmatimonadota bacterium]